MTEATVDLKGAKILLVDDTPANLDVLCALLEMEGYDLALAPDGPMALTIAARLCPDLVLLDIMMPGMDGFEVCRRLKADDVLRDIPVIFITARDGATDVVTGLRLGGVDYITKPFRDEEVLARVRTQLHLGRLRRELERRNHTLEERNCELRDALQELRDTQDQLLLREKMASLGSLTAGITHEINNALGAALSALDVSTRCADRLGGCDPHHLERLLDTLGTNLGLARTAGGRIAAIVSNLKTFAGLDEEDCSAADAQIGIESVLALMQAELDGRIEVETDFQPVPSVACPPGQLNQVFHNLLKNAAAAIDGRGTIRVEVDGEPGHVLVTIRDTGRGIEPERLPRIFDFGFSREGPRVKMTSGLSTAYGIVQRHGGELTLESDVGVGTRVLVRLPTVTAAAAMGTEGEGDDDG